MSDIPNPGQTRGSTGARAATFDLNASPRPMQDASAAAVKQHFKQAGRWLLNIPPSLIEEHSAWIANGTWQGTFDCALWLRTPAGVRHPLQLAVRYLDQAGEKTLLIDRCQPGSHRTVLLNGSVTLTVTGSLHNIDLFLLGTSDPALVDEWHFTPRQKRIC